MEIILRGVRGSIATPAPDALFYGGNTACVELRTKNGGQVFFDAGTGLRDVWGNLPDSGEANVFITHGHADHVVGLWFLKTLHLPRWTTHLYLPEWLGQLPDHFYRCGFFPVPVSQLKGRLVRHLLKAGEKLSLSLQNSEMISVETFAVNHPGGGLGYRVQADDAVFLYTGDHEITGDAASKAMAADLLREVDLAVVDAQYNLADYHPGFGHSAWEDWLEAASRSSVGTLVFSHHAPSRSDHDLDRLEKSLYELRTGDGGFQVYVGREGQHLTLGPTSALWRKPAKLFQFTEELSAYKEESAVLDRVLAKAREITQADAGTIFLLEDEELVFAYIHNDSLFEADKAHRHAYTSFRLPLNDKSIAGYAAVNGLTLNFPNVRDIPEGAPYRFNDALDRRTGYFTISMLTLPFLNKSGQTIGVLQLINSLDPLYKTPVAFSSAMERNARVLVREVAGILERGALERRIIHAMLRMASVHDPCETGVHAERVGAMAAELYHLWAVGQGHTPGAINREKSRLRLAAMLHDIGKVGVSDLILQKPGPLTKEEFMAIRRHTELGASILAETPGEIAALARDIARHHHQRWDGRGYAGTDDADRLQGEDIPLGARITAIADVFDALVAPRVYKAPWTFSAALTYLRQESGHHFDPALVECLDGLTELISLIYEKFPDKKPAER